MAEFRRLANPDPEWAHVSPSSQKHPQTLNTASSRTICPPGTRVIGMNRAHDPITLQDGLTITELDVSIWDGNRIAVRIAMGTHLSTPHTNSIVY
ncbi:hypothetical protein J3459_008464 [Metarhizium acridum]|uniref:uncharacterized protein n=1 Tax=Metarhizium acridum TaxID=92637 RepID=UPI001C6C8E97|nr:hypothetical protein J3458_000277 [Metarhizium acridum]KAG8426062.1 hypothetical protein J3459_008464 [Metarhizium acridum]